MKSRVRPVGLFRTVMWRVLPAAVLILLGIWLAVSWVAKSVVREQIHSRLEFQASLLAAGTQAKIDTLIEATQAIAVNHLMVNGLVDTGGRDDYLPAFFRSLRLPGPDGATIALVDYRGRGIASNTPNVSFEEEPWVQRALEGHEHIDLSRNGLHIAVPVFYFGLPEGAIVVSYPKSKVGELLNIPSIAHAVAVIDPDGVVLHSTDPKFTLVGDSKPGAASDWLQAQAGLPDLSQLSLITAIPVDDAFTSLLRLDKILLVAMFLDLLALLAGVMFTARLITTPLSQLTDKIKQIGRTADLSLQVEESGPAELHDLSHSFNKMTGQLHEAVVSKNYVQKIIDGSPTIVCSLDADGTARTVNPAGERITGYTADEIIGADWWQTVSPGRHDTHALCNQLTDNADSRDGLELTVVTKDHQTRAIVWNKTTVSDPVNGRCDDVWFGHDITAVKQAEQRFRLVVESSPNGMVMVDRTGKILFINPQTEFLFGYTRDELIGESIEVLVPPVVHAHHARYREQFFANPKVYTLGAERDLSCLHKNGSEFPIELTLSPIETESGLAVLATIVDITARKDAQAKLLASEERFDLAVHGSQDGLWDWDMVTEEVWFSARWKEQIGYRDEELTNEYETWTALLHPDDKQLTLESLNRAVEEDQPYDVEFRLKAKEGEYLWIRARAVVIRDDRGKPIRMAGSHQDITDRKLAEQEILIKNRDLQTLLHVTSHDLREQLRSIQSFSQLLCDRYADQIDEKGVDYLRRIHRGAERLNRLIQDILTLSRAQREEVSNDPIKVDAIVSDVLDRLARRIEQTHAKIHVAQDIPTIYGDRRWITQAIYNLIANALKFTNNGQAPDIEVAGYQGKGDDAGSVGIVVRDRGPGVAPDQRDRIFRLFQRAVGREIDGTGAGLAIVHEIAQRHGGQAWVQPRQGGGAAFFVTFTPAAESCKDSCAPLTSIATV